ncbi:hypothetical protein [Microvirga sp. Mcv34]|uniref:hypothetical protein n=1 Tax=Microvirga sp. Mcv34 TaxID=2926016 RepID=UPI0021C844CB|nr:hypothetical protein [Microvirga sp. Mcv34]
MKTYLLPLLIIALPLSGCSAAYIMGEYGQSSGHEVRLSCRRAYRVYEKADKLLVEAFSASEAAAAACLVLQADKELDQIEHPVRYWDVAEAYLKNMKNQRCAISGGRQLELLHSEFSFACLPR